jgi:hypothetical protein
MQFFTYRYSQADVVFQACKHQLSPSKAEHEQQPKAKRLIASYWKAFASWRLLKVSVATGRCENPECRNITEYGGISRNITEYHGIWRNIMTFSRYIAEHHDIFRW